MKSQGINAVLILFFLLSTLSQGFGMTKQELINLFATADTPDSSKRCFDAAMENLDLLEGILLTPAGHPIARFNSLSFLAYATHKNKITKTRFFKILINQLKNINSLSRNYDVSDNQLLISNLIIYFSYFPSGSANLAVQENFANLNLLVESYRENHLFSDERIKNDILSFIEEAKIEYNRQHKQAAINKLNSMAESHLTQQNIEDEQFRQILIKYVLNLSAHIESQ